MSTNLYWEPNNRKKNSFGGLKLKEILRNRYAAPVKVILASSDTAYFEALRDADVPGAEDILSAIAKHNEIKVTEE